MVKLVALDKSNEVMDELENEAIILITLDGITNFPVRFEQEENAFSPILVKLVALDKSSAIIFLFCENELFSILVILSLTTNDPFPDEYPVIIVGSELSTVTQISPICTGSALILK